MGIQGDLSALHRGSACDRDLEDICFYFYFTNTASDL